MADDEDDPRQQLRAGLGLLAKAARGAASRIKTELDRATESTTHAANEAAAKAAPATTALTGALGDAGRELARAASNVVGRLGELATGRAPSERVRIDPDATARDGAAPGGAAHGPPGSAPPEQPAKPKGPTEEDPGFRIAGDSEGGPGRPPGEG